MAANNVGWADVLRGKRAGLTSAALAIALIIVWGRIDTIYNEPPIWVPFVSFAVLAGRSRTLPLALVCFWLVGFVSLTWSLGPGNTLITFMWEALSIAAFSAGLAPLAVGTVLAYALLDGYLDVVALATFQSQSYLSGSIGYVAGAIGASATVLAVALATRPQSRWADRVTAVVAGSIGLMLALSSGSRAVYLGLVVGAVALLAARLAHRSWRQLGAAVLLMLSIATTTYALEALSGYSIVGPAWQEKATMAKAAEAVTEYGVLTQRVRLWSQSVEAALNYPLGTGLGTYAATAHAFQAFPMLWSSSPHNYLIQVLHTGGWLRLALLIAVFVSCIRWGFRDEGLPWTVAGLALATTTLFDVTGGYPKIMTLLFMLMGAGYFAGRCTVWVKTTGRSSRFTARKTVNMAALVCLALVTAWWYLPCRAVQCSVDRYMGLEAKTIPALRLADSSERKNIIDRVRSLYPRSLWVIKAELAYSTTATERLALLREIAETYPYQSPDNYIEWAKSAIDLGEYEQARQALLTGLDYFPRDQYPLGEMRITPEQYDAWADAAEQMLRDISDFEAGAPH